LSQPNSFKGELYRKAIHIASSAIPIGYYFLDKSIVLYVLVPVLFLMFLIEFFKYKVDFLYNLYLKLFKSLLREHEYDRSLFRINGASWVLLGDVLSIIIFPKYIAITGMLLLSLSDSLSAIVGRTYGKRYYAPNRSYIGSFTFLFIGILIIVFSPKYFHTFFEYIIGFIAVFLTTIADAIGIPADDNIFIPIISCIILYILYILFFPAIFTINTFKLL
jgi:dolichol kinase